MPIYRLEPIEDFLGEQSWRHSLLQAVCWVKAPDEDHARLVMASATAKAEATPGDLMESPWLSPVLTMCLEESPEFRMEPEIAVRVDGVTKAWAAPPER
jgi:hypothetical protein